MSSSGQISVQWLNSHFPDLSNLQPLGSGGYKLVFSATHPTDGEIVLKLIHPQQTVEEVQREIHAVSQVASRRVPRILAHGNVTSQLGDCFWFREQRILGQTLTECIQPGPLETTSLLRLGLQVLEALEAAENVHIVHRDVKPPNIICDTQGQFWLIDFGVARHLKLSSLTPTAQYFGKFTPGYAPAEQFRNIKADIDARSDLFALGVTLYECATGTNPFRHGAINDLDVLKRVETLPLTRLILNIANPAKFTDLIAAMTQKRRDHRPRTAQDALQWMQEICAEEGIQ